MPANWPGACLEGGRKREAPGTPQNGPSASHDPLSSLGVPAPPSAPAYPGRGARLSGAAIARAPRGGGR
ncbi:MAG: hypothetical protein Kow0062_07060 [Acidobacteriota bacterium]